MMKLKVNYRIILIQLTILFGIFFNIANAQKEITEEEIQNVNLTPSDVKTFIKEFDGIKTGFEKLGLQYDLKNISGNELYNYHKASSEADKVAKKHGYKNYEDLVYKVSAIAITYSAVKYDEQLIAKQPEIQEALQQLEANPNLTPEQKKQMKAMYTQGLKSIEEYKNIATEQNMKVVKPFVSELDALFDQD